MLLKINSSTMNKPTLKPTLRPPLWSKFKKTLEKNEPTKPTRRAILACNPMKRLATPTHYYYTSLRYPTSLAVNSRRLTVESQRRGLIVGEGFSGVKQLE